MAPTTRSNRAEKLANEKLLASGTSLNHRGFPALPNELYSEILSHLPAMHVPQFVWLKEKPDPHRQVTLLALSQTCKALRSFFLRYAWERIEIFGGMCTQTGTVPTVEEYEKRSLDKIKLIDRKFAQEILRQLETVTVRNPELRQYVRVVNVMFVKISHADMITPELSEALSLLPHVHTLQISAKWGFIRTNFSNYTYPKLRNVYLLGHFKYEDILQACPNLTNYIMTGHFPVAQALQSGSTRMEVLGVIGTISRFTLSLEELVRGFPHIRDISLHQNLLRSYEDDIRCLSSLSLHTLRLYLGGWKPYHSCWPIIPATDAERTKWIEVAKITLKKCPTHEADTNMQKRVVVINVDMSVETHLVSV